MTNLKFEDLSIQNAKDVIQIIQSSRVVKNLIMDEEIELIGIDNFEHAIRIENCVISKWSGSSTQFTKLVEFYNCHFDSCSFMFTYFLAGFKITNCTFEKYIDFQAGGHNAESCAVEINKNTFNSYVNFFDCWYHDPVLMTDNEFKKGTNILCGTNKVLTTFVLSPIIENNRGNLKINSEMIEDSGYLN